MDFLWHPACILLRMNAGSVYAKFGVRSTGCMLKKEEEQMNYHGICRGVIWETCC
jgi:hypothetical protein